MRTLGKWILRVVLALVALAVVVLAVLGIRVNHQLSRKHTVADVAIAVPSDSAAVARGQHLSVIFDCQGCHGTDLAGQSIFDAPPIGRVYAPNLTRAGITKDFTPADWNRAVRHGVAPDGRGLFVMPSELYWYLSDADLGALIAYAHSVPAVEKASPRSTLRPGGWLIATFTPGGLVAADKIDHAAIAPPAPPVGVTASYGGYLAHACNGCHGAELSGGVSGEPGAPPAPNLTRGPGGHLAHWTQADFVRTLRTGQTPEGKTLSRYMPWPNFGQMTDDELAALWLHLQALPPKASTAPAK